MLPVIQPEIVDAVKASGYDHDAWVVRIMRENPQVFTLMGTLVARGSHEGVAAVMLLYRLLATQAEADELEEMFK